MTAAGSMVGAALRKARKAAGMGRDEAAQAVGVSLRTLDSDERGDARGVPLSRVDDYCKAYGVSPSKLLEAAAHE